MELPQFKTRDVRVSDITIVSDTANASVIVTETRYWGLSTKRLVIACACANIKRKKVCWLSEHNIFIDEESDVHQALTNTLKDMRRMSFVVFNQLLAYRLQIHIRKHHGRNTTPVLS